MKSARRFSFVRLNFEKRVAFRSWRDFSYLDSEDKTKGEDRWERREIEKQNKVCAFCARYNSYLALQAEREQNRKKYLKRLAKLVELAHDKDPRVQRFREDDRRAKDVEKERRRQERQKIADEAAAQERERLQQAELERQQQREAQKHAADDKLKARKQLQSKRKALRELMIAQNYFTTDLARSERLMEKVERACLDLNEQELQTLLDELANVDQYNAALDLLVSKVCAFWKPQFANVGFFAE